MAEKRKFTVHPAIIFDLIKAQAGSLGKAVLECVMNSVDSGSTKVDITVDTRGVTITDDGQGFRSRQEIEDWFEVFGFPHEEGDGRVYGKFGIGRAQLWSFCSTVWRTNEFEMAVDIKNRGLDYDLKEDQPRTKGVTIVGTFYNKLTTSDLMAFQRQIAELAAYCPVPVNVNGTCISKDASKEKWDHVTDEAYIRLKETGDLVVYNLGVFVCKLSSYHVGSGGVVVTKPGIRLALNMARNDILVSECKIWKKIKPFLQEKSDERVRTKPTRLSEGELENLARRLLAEEVSYDSVRERKLITDIQGRHHTIEGLINALGHGYSDKRPLTVAKEGSRLGEQAHVAKLAFVLHEKTLDRFDASSVKDFRAKLADAMSDERRWLKDALLRAKIAETVQKAAPSLKEGYQILPYRQLTEEEKFAVKAIETMNNMVSIHLVRNEYISHETSRRQIEVGVSDTAHAWTDGRSRIVIERRQLKLVKEGLGGLSGLANLLVHEYLHDAEDIGSHSHDMEFYKRYHDATVGSDGVLEQAIARGLAEYIRLVRRSKTRRIPATLARHITRIEELASMPVFTDEESGEVAVATASAA